MKKIAFTGGGTIGHVAVNLALIPEAEQRGIETVYIGSKNGIEKDMITDSAKTLNIFRYLVVNCEDICHLKT